MQRPCPIFPSRCFPKNAPAARDEVPIIILVKIAYSRKSRAFTRRTRLAPLPSPPETADLSAPKRHPLPATSEQIMDSERAAHVGRFSGITSVHTGCAVACINEWRRLPKSPRQNERRSPNLLSLNPRSSKLRVTLDEPTWQLHPLHRRTSTLTPSSHPAKSDFPPMLSPRFKHREFRQQVSLSER
jgi:hypothetical protein